MQPENGRAEWSSRLLSRNAESGVFTNTVGNEQPREFVPESGKMRDRENYFERKGSVRIVARSLPKVRPVWRGGAREMRLPERRR